MDNLYLEYFLVHDRYIKGLHSDDMEMRQKYLKSLKSILEYVIQEHLPLKIEYQVTDLIENIVMLEAGDMQLVSQLAVYLLVLDGDKSNQMENDMWLTTQSKFNTLIIKTAQNEKENLKHHKINFDCFFMHANDLLFEKIEKFDPSETRKWLEYFIELSINVENPTIQMKMIQFIRKRIKENCKVNEIQEFFTQTLKNLSNNDIDKKLILFLSLMEEISMNFERNANENVLLYSGFWDNIISLNIRTADYRKESFAILEKSIDIFVRYSKTDVLIGKSVYFKPNDSQWIKAWNSYFSIYLGLTEKQSHLILPALELWPDINLIPSDWQVLLISMVLEQSSNTVLKNGLLSILKYTKYKVLQTINSNLIESLNSDFLYDENNYIKIELVKYFAFLTHVDIDLTDYMQMVHWKFVPLYNFIGAFGEIYEKQKITMPEKFLMLLVTLINGIPSTLYRDILVHYTCKSLDYYAIDKLAIFIQNISNLDKHFTWTLWPATSELLTNLRTENSSIRIVTLLKMWNCIAIKNRNQTMYNQLITEISTMINKKQLEGVTNSDLKWLIRNSNNHRILMLTGNVDQLYDEEDFKEFPALRQFLYRFKVTNHTDEKLDLNEINSLPMDDEYVRHCLDIKLLQESINNKFESNLVEFFKNYLTQTLKQLKIHGISRNADLLTRTLESIRIALTGPKPEIYHEYLLHFFLQLSELVVIHYKFADIFLNFIVELLQTTSTIDFNKFIPVKMAVNSFLYSVNLHAESSEVQIICRNYVAFKMDVLETVLDKFMRNIEGLSDLIVDHILEIANEKRKHFPKSPQHWRMFRLFQMLIRNECVQRNYHILKRLIDNLPLLIANMHPDVRVLLEITIAQHNLIARQNFFAQNCLNIGDLLEVLDQPNLSASVYQSVFSIILMHFKNSSYLNPPNYVSYYNDILTYTFWSQFNIRLFAQFLICFPMPFTQDMIKLMKGFENTIRSIQKALDNTPQTKMLLKDIRYVMDLSELTSLRTIFYTIPKIANMWNETLIFNEEVTAVNEDYIIFGLSVDSSSSISDKNVSNATIGVRDTLINIQKKFGNEVWNCSGLELNNSKSTDSSVILVTSLIEHLPNLGGLSRTAEIFGVKEVVISSLRHIENREFQALSMTSEKWLNYMEVTKANLIQYLLLAKENGYKIIGAEQTTKSVSLVNYVFPKRSLILLGNEKRGIPPELISLLDEAIEIPQFGNIRSLNVHVTGSIFLWEYVKQHLFIQ